MNNWYIINTQPFAEFKVVGYLCSKDIKTFMPKLSVTRKHARKVEKVFRPLFPGYIFVNANIKNSIRLINNAIGVKSLLSAGNTPSIVPQNVIKQIYSITDNDGVVMKLDLSNYAEGQEVKINQGIFKGSIGNFCSMASKDRVSILLAFLGKQVKISVSSLHISAV